jgi:hypothetical protein
VVKKLAKKTSQYNTKVNELETKTIQYNNEKTLREQCNARETALKSSFTTPQYTTKRCESQTHTINGTTGSSIDKSYTWIGSNAASPITLTINPGYTVTEGNYPIYLKTNKGEIWKQVIISVGGSVCSRIVVEDVEPIIQRTDTTTIKKSLDGVQVVRQSEEEGGGILMQIKTDDELTTLRDKVVIKFIVDDQSIENLHLGKGALAAIYKMAGDKHIGVHQDEEEKERGKEIKRLGGSEVFSFPILDSAKTSEAELIPGCEEIKINRYEYEGKKVVIKGKIDGAEGVKKSDKDLIAQLFLTKYKGALCTKAQEKHQEAAISFYKEASGLSKSYQVKYDGEKTSWCNGKYTHVGNFINSSSKDDLLCHDSLSGKIKVMESLTEEGNEHDVRFETKSLLYKGQGELDRWCKTDAEDSHGAYIQKFYTGDINGDKKIDLICNSNRNTRILLGGEGESRYDLEKEVVVENEFCAQSGAKLVFGKFGKGEYSMLCITSGIPILGKLDYNIVSKEEGARWTTENQELVNTIYLIPEAHNRLEDEHLRKTINYLEYYVSLKPSPLQKQGLEDALNSLGSANPSKQDVDKKIECQSRDNVGKKYLICNMKGRSDCEISVLKDSGIRELDLNRYKVNNGASYNIEKYMAELEARCKEASGPMTTVKHSLIDVVSKWKESYQDSLVNSESKSKPKIQTEAVKFHYSAGQWCSDKISDYLIAGDFNDDKTDDLMCYRKNGAVSIMMSSSTEYRQYAPPKKSGERSSGTTNNTYDKLYNISVWGEEKGCKGKIIAGNFSLGLGDGENVSKGLDLYCNTEGLSKVILNNLKKVEDKKITTWEKNDIATESDGTLKVGDQGTWCKSGSVLGGDFNGDGLTDIICITDDPADWIY